MNREQRERAYLILADGTIFEGESMGKRGEVVGEAVFTTAMSGYMETLSDPSNYGQIVVQTFPMVGNSGAITIDMESERVGVSGYVVREICGKGSNFRFEEELEQFLIKNEVIGICGIDTRSLTRMLRDRGVMGAMITDSKRDLDQKLKRIKEYRVSGSMEATSTKEIKKSGNQEGTRIVLWDFGVKGGIEQKLLDRGCGVVRVPYNTSAEEIEGIKPDGILLSNGGGDPVDQVEIIKEIGKIMQKNIPIFGICLGHQLLALAHGAKTKRLKYGHRGGNQPIKDVDTGRVYITSQNHGYVVVPSSLPEKIARINLINANDKTCEGIEYLDKPAFSVQFHPEGSCGPCDTEFLFDKFVKMARGE